MRLLPQPFSRIAASYSVGFLALQQGDIDRASSVLQRTLGLCQRASNRLFFPLVAAALGLAHAFSGALAEALPLLEQVLGYVAHPMVGWALCVAQLSEAYLVAGRSDDAARLAQRALDLARDHQERRTQAYALRLLGDIAAYRDPPERERAEAAYQQARALADELGMRPLLAHCHRGLGTLYLQMQRWEQARAALSASIALYRAMEMTYWLRQAEVARARVE